MKTQIRFILACLIYPLFLFCTSSRKQQSDVDNFEMGYEEDDASFAYISDPARTHEVVKDGIERIYPDIKEALKLIDTIYFKRDTISLGFSIKPNGNIKYIRFIDSISLETSAFKIFKKKFIDRNVLDSMAYQKMITGVTVPSYLDANKAIQLSDSIKIDYYKRRSTKGIRRVVYQNLPALRYAYTVFLRKKPSIKGKIKIKFSIDERGYVIFCRVISSTMKDPEFEKIVVGKIKKWRFGKIRNPKDLTEVVYPFIFSE